MYAHQIFPVESFPGSKLSVLIKIFKVNFQLNLKVNPKLNAVTTRVHQMKLQILYFHKNNSILNRNIFILHIWIYVFNKRLLLVKVQFLFFNLVSCRSHNSSSSFSSTFSVLLFFKSILGCILLAFLPSKANLIASKNSTLSAVNAL